MATPITFAVILIPIYSIWLGSEYLNATSRVFDLYSNTPVLILGLGVLFCLLAGQFDLSVASTASMGAILVLGLRVRSGLPFWLALLVVLCFGALGGVVNGFLVARLHINAFIATLGTSGVYAGLMTAYTKGAPVVAASGDEPVPTWFTGQGSLGSFPRSAPWIADWIIVAVVAAVSIAAVRERTADSKPAVRTGAAVAIALLALAGGIMLHGRANWTVLLVIILTLLTWLTLRYTMFGRGLMATGSNPVAARLAGVKVDHHIFSAFVISGVFAAIAGIVVASSLGSAAPGVAERFLLPAYSAVFLSTVLLSHGRFHPWGTTFGGLAIVFVSQGLVIGGVPFTWTAFLNGVVLLIAVAISTLTRRGRAR